jgi:hypothetical protein
MSDLDSEQFHLGKMVGETLGRISEQERIVALLEVIEVTYYDEELGRRVTLTPDFTDIFRIIRRES